MSGKLIIHGLNQSFLIGGKIDIFFDTAKIGSVGKKDTAEFLFEKNVDLVLKCGVNPLKGHIELKNGMQTEIQCVYNRVTGAIQAQVLATTPYQETDTGMNSAQAVEHPIYTLDGGLKDFLFVYEDRIVISHRGAGNAIMMGIKGDKTIYYSDITSVQYKESGISAGYIQFSISGGNESKKGVFDAVSDENTITLKNKPNIIKEAKETVDFLNKKIREAKTGAHTAQTVIQQNSAADELKKFKELLDSGIITQEEFDAKKKQLLGL